MGEKRKGEKERGIDRSVEREGGKGKKGMKEGEAIDDKGRDR